MATNNSWNNQIAAANSAITLNSGTNTVSVSSDASATTVNIGTGAAAKAVTVGSINTTSSLLLNCGTTAGTISLSSASGTIMNALGTGEINYPLQPCFLASQTSDQSNVTGDGTQYTVTFTNEIFDQNGDFDGTSTFTAPVTGRYYFGFNIYVSGLTSSHTNDLFIFISSNATYRGFQFNWWTASTSGGEIILTNNFIVDMDAADTSVLKMDCVGGTKVVDIIGSTTAGFRAPNYFGYLMC